MSRVKQDDLSLDKKVTARWLTEGHHRLSELLALVTCLSGNDGLGRGARVVYLLIILSETGRPYM